MTKTITIDGTTYNLVPQEVQTQVVEEQPRRFYPNGAVMEVMDGEDYYLINTYEIHKYTQLPTYAHASQEERMCFLTEEQAEKELARIKTYNRLYKKVTEINHDNGWVGKNYEDQGDYCLCHINQSFGPFCSETVTDYRTCNVTMCIQAVEWLLSDGVTDDERKIWLGIYE